MADEKTLFQRIIDGEIPADFVYQDDQCVAFRDINPAAPVHLLVVPRKLLVNAASFEAEDAALVGHLVLVARLVAEQEGFAEAGYRTVFNVGKHGGQSVDHMHLHVLAGRSLAWPPG